MADGWPITERCTRCFIAALPEESSVFRIRGLPQIHMNTCCTAARSCGQRSIPWCAHIADVVASRRADQFTGNKWPLFFSVLDVWRRAVMEPYAWRPPELGNEAQQYLNVITRFMRYCCPSIVAPIVPRVEGGAGESHTGNGVDESRPACCALLSCQSAIIAPESLRHLTRAGRLCPGAPPRKTTETAAHERSDRV
jgi:hypothetical protein